MANFWKFTDNTARYYPQYTLLASPGVIYDFGGGSQPGDGRWLTDPGPATGSNPSVFAPANGPAAPAIVLTGTGAPTLSYPATQGDGDAYIDLVGKLYYTRANGAWSVGVALNIGDLSATYARTIQARPGSLCVALGDSITLSNDDNPNFGQQGSFLNWAAILSGQRVQYVYNAGIAGNKINQMLGRFDTDVTPYSPTVVIILGGTNDAGVTSIASWSADLASIVAKCRAIGAVPVIGTVPPSSSSAKLQPISQMNGFIRLYAAQQGITVIDFWNLLVDPVTANYKAAYLNDGTHPNAAGYQAMGQLVSDTLSPLLPANAPKLCGDDVDANSCLFKGTFGGYSGSSLPTGWIDNAGIPSGSVLSYTTDAAVPGQLVTLTQTATAGVRQLGYAQFIGATTLSNSPGAGTNSVVLPIRADYAGVLFIGTPGSANYEVVKILSSAGGGPQTETLVTNLQFAHTAGEPVIANAAPGDTMIYSGLVTSDGGVDSWVDTVCTGAAYSPYPMRVTGAITRGIFHKRFVVPASTTAINYRMRAGIGTGVVKYGRLGVYNATRLGI